MLAGVANSYSKAGLREVSLLRSLARAARSCAPAAFSSRLCMRLSLYVHTYYMKACTPLVRSRRLLLQVLG